MMFEVAKSFLGVLISDDAKGNNLINATCNKVIP